MALARYEGLLYWRGAVFTGGRAIVLQESGLERWLVVVGATAVQVPRPITAAILLKDCPAGAIDGGL